MNNNFNSEQAQRDSMQKSQADSDVQIQNDRLKLKVQELTNALDIMLKKAENKNNDNYEINQ